MLSPRKEGQELPDPFRMPLELPSVSLQLTKPVPVADAVAALGNAAVPIEAAPALKGEATIDAAETPLAERSTRCASRSRRCGRSPTA